MKELRERGSREAAQKAMFSALPNGALGNPAAMPVHFIDGKWYLEVTPQGWVSKNDALKMLGIQKELEIGDVDYDKARNVMRIWQGEQGWLEVTGELAASHGLSEQFKLTPSAIASLKDHMVEFEEEQERKRLRQQLLDAQEGEEF